MRTTDDIGANLGVNCRAEPCAACPVRHLSICDALEAQELVRLARIVETRRYAAHELVFSEEDAATHLFNVTSGIVKLYKLMSDGRRQIVGFLGRGDFLGLAIAEHYAYTAEAVTDSALCRFPRRDLERLLVDLPHMQQRLFAVANNELLAAQEQMMLLGRKTAREKICSFFLTVIRRAVRRGEPADPIDLPMTRNDIADYLGLTTETVSRTLTQLKGEGVIRLGAGNKVAIPDRARLEALASAH